MRFEKIPLHHRAHLIHLPGCLPGTTPFPSGNLPGLNVFYIGDAFSCNKYQTSQSEGFPRTGYLFPARDGLWPGLKKEVLLARRRRRRRRHLGGEGGCSPPSLECVFSKNTNVYS